MKTSILVFLFLVFTLASFSQSHPFKLSKEKLRVEQIPSLKKPRPIQTFTQALPEIPKLTKDVNIVSVIDIGTAANAFTYWKPLSSLWVDPQLNTVINIHRMGGVLDPLGSSSDLAYDISKDGGMNWENMIPVFFGYPCMYCWVGARYPQAAIYNPDGNTNPDNAYVSYFAPIIGGDFPNIWNNTHGVGSIGDTSYRTQTPFEIDSLIYVNVPRGFDITSTGNIFVVDDNTEKLFDNESVYHDSLIISVGTWDDDLEDFTYDRQLLEALIDDNLNRPLDYKIAFTPDGETGYIVMIANNGEASQIEGFSNLYPIYWKTLDGGDTWGEPYFIQLDGSNGLAGIVYHHLTDEMIWELFGDDPPDRDSISYTTAYDCDIAVTDDGDLHIAVVIGLTGDEPYSIVTTRNFIAAVDIFTTNGGFDWTSEEMGRLNTFRGSYGENFQDNRIQITTDPDSQILFISWLDTDIEDAEENNQPNIFARGFNPATYCKTTYNSEDYPTNVTVFSDGMWQSNLMVAPKFCFEPEPGTYNIPFTYAQMSGTPIDPYDEIQIKYIQDFTFTDSDFLPCPIGVEEVVANSPALEVLHISPNPFRGETNIQIKLGSSQEVRVIVYSITGRQVSETSYGQLGEGNSNLTLQLSELSSGMYFYTVVAGNNCFSGKLVVE